MLAATGVDAAAIEAAWDAGVVEGAGELADVDDNAGSALFCDCTISALPKDGVGMDQDESPVRVLK